MKASYGLKKLEIGTLLEDGGFGTPIGFIPETPENISIGTLSDIPGMPDELESKIYTLPREAKTEFVIQDPKGLFKRFFFKPKMIIVKVKLGRKFQGKRFARPVYFTIVAPKNTDVIAFSKWIKKIYEY